MSSSNQRQILLIAPALITESLLPKLISMNNSLDIKQKENELSKSPSLIIWNIYNLEYFENLKLEIINLKSRWSKTPILLICFGNINFKYEQIISLNCEGLLVDPSLDKVSKSINTIIEGGRVFDTETSLNEKSVKAINVNFSKKLLLQGLSQIDIELSKLKLVNKKTSNNFLFEFIMNGRIRELEFAKSLLIVPAFA